MSNVAARREIEQRRRAARDRVSNLVTKLEGQILSEAVIEEIAYHALLAELPAKSINSLLKDANEEGELIHCEDIQFFRASGQMAAVTFEDACEAEEGPVLVPKEEPLPPVVALLDGLPLQNHRRLVGRLVVDDPDGFEAEYPARDRCHGTAMASLILHGDLEAGEPPLPRPLYVRPILRPVPSGQGALTREVVPERMLVVDLIHRAVRRIFEGEGKEPAAAPDVCVINLSIGIPDRPFYRAMTPLARLLDWLAWKYGVLFVVSAGNHLREIAIDVPRARWAQLPPDELQAHVIRAIAADARHRRLLSPAEAVNALTVGATHSDAADGNGVQGAVSPYVEEGLPSVINAQGMGFRRSIKPDVLMPGGRVVLKKCLTQSQPDTFTSLEVYLTTRPPGHKVAAPGPNAGDLDFTCHTRGTSNAAALASRTAGFFCDVLEELRTEPGGETLDTVPRGLWLKTLLVHGAAWRRAGEVLTDVLCTSKNRRQFKEYVTRLLGYGAVDPSRVQACSDLRVTALGGGRLDADQAHIHRFPLPPSLSGKAGMRRLTITLAWFTPVRATHKAWRHAHLWFEPRNLPSVARAEADWQAARRGTVQHECFEGKRAHPFVDGDHVEIQVNCRAAAGPLEDSVPYALAITLEVATDIGIDIYDEVRARVHAARVAVTAST